MSNFRTLPYVLAKMQLSEVMSRYTVKVQMADSKSFIQSSFRFQVYLNVPTKWLEDLKKDKGN